MTKREREHIVTLTKVLQTHVSCYLDAQEKADDLLLLCEDTQHRIAFVLRDVRENKPVRIGR